MIHSSLNGPYCLIYVQIHPPLGPPSPLPITQGLTQGSPLPLASSSIWTDKKKICNLNVYMYMEINSLLSSVMIVETLSFRPLNHLQSETQLEWDK